MLTLRLKCSILNNKKGGRAMGMSLKAARVNRNLKQQEAAKLLKVSVYTLINWEKGKSYPNAIQIKDIEKIYKISYDDIIFLPRLYA